MSEEQRGEKAQAQVGIAMFEYIEKRGSALGFAATRQEQLACDHRTALPSETDLLIKLKDGQLDIALVPGFNFDGDLEAKSLGTVEFA